MTGAIMTGQARFEVWGSTAHLLVGDADAVGPAEAILRRVLRRIDRACNRFVADSALSRLNAVAGRTVLVDPVLLTAIQVALTAAEQSGGLVDPTVGPALAAIGYDRDLAAIPVDNPEPIRPVPAAGYRTVHVDERLGTVQLLPGTALDLGATAKALAADLAAAEVADRLGCPVLVNLGGDLATAGPRPADGWRVRVTEDHRAGHELAGQVVTVRSGGLATSSRTVRTWRRAGQQIHHLVDPRTGQPAATTWRCVSVAAADCVGANVAATAAMVLGPGAPLWLAERGLPARLVAADGTVHTTDGWPNSHEEGRAA
jgi:thiamine biosynthesis lipoprotein